VADFLDRVLQQLADQLPELTPERRLDVELQIRQAEGGRGAGYIAKRPTMQRVMRIGQALQQGVAISQVVMAEQCHRATAYRILARPIKRPR
jgi:parvulin-like peptidyl-prolyl isomerase